MKRLMLLGAFMGLGLLVACGDDNGSSPTAFSTVSSSLEDFALSSSSVVLKESSSSVTASVNSDHLAWDYLNPDLEFGEFTDERDGLVYKYVVVGNDWIMVENLNYADSIRTPNLKGNSWCLNNSQDSCSKYGRYYTWSAVMDTTPEYNDKAAPFMYLNLGMRRQGICPEGWYIFLNRNQWDGGYFPKNGAFRLCAKKGWNNDLCTDEYGFAALPNGYYDDGEFKEVGVSYRFWSAMLDNVNAAGMGEVQPEQQNDFLNSWAVISTPKRMGAAVRCMRTLPKTTSSSSISSSSSN